MNKQIDVFALYDAHEVLGSPIVRDLAVVDELHSTAALCAVARQSQSAFVALFTKPVQMLLGTGALERMAQAAADTGSAMVYADHRKLLADGQPPQPHPPSSTISRAASATISTLARCCSSGATCCASGPTSRAPHNTATPDCTTCAFG